MRKYLRVYGIIGILLLACGSSEQLALQTVAFQTAISGLTETATAIVPTATRNPSFTPSPFPPTTKIPTTTAVAVRGPEFSYDGINFTMDPVLGDEVFINENQESPQFTQFSFAIDGFCREVGCVTVYQVSEFREYPFGDSIIDDLQEAIGSVSTLYFPTWGAAIIMRAQTQQLLFQNGAGIRAIVERGQMGYFVNNEELVYDFHGLTNDGQYYVRVTYPLDAPILLDTADPAENTNQEAIPVPELPDDDSAGQLLLNELMLEYNQEAQRQLDVLDSSSFTPDFELLDALVGSLLVTSSSGE